jgi:hypothetical protein
MYEKIFEFINYDALPYKKYDNFGEYFNFDINDVDEELLKDFGIVIKDYGYSFILASEGNGVLLKELLEVNKYLFTTNNPIQGYFDGKNYYIKLSTFKLIVTNYMRFSKIKNKTKKIEELKELIKKHKLNIEITKYKNGYRSDIVEPTNVDMYY